VIKITVEEINNTMKEGYNLIRAVSNLSISVSNPELSNSIWELNDKLRYVLTDLGCEALKNLNNKGEIICLIIVNLVRIINN